MKIPDRWPYGTSRAGLGIAGRGHEGEASARDRVSQDPSGGFLTRPPTALNSAEPSVVGASDHGLDGAFLALDLEFSKSLTAPLSQRSQR